MKKYLQKKLNNEKGMTLIELLAVIVIIAIIAAIAIPAIGNIIENSRVGAIKSDAQNLLSAAQLASTDTGDTTSTLAELQAGGFVDDLGSFASPGVVTSINLVTASGVSTWELTGVGITGGVQVTFTDASRDEIEAVANGSDTGGTGVAINRNYTP